MRNKSASTFLFLEIAESLRRRISAGELRPGDRLPPVRSMAQRWNCTPGTVGRAYAALADEGLIEAHRGSGTRVTLNLLEPGRPVWGWASLINRAEQLLLYALGQGQTPEQASAALSVAISRWRDLQRVGTPPAKVAPDHGQPIRFVGSHDLALETLAQMVSESDGSVQLDVHFRGSLGGLMALNQGTADIAGVHLWDESTDSYNVPFVRRLLPGRRVALLSLARRELGLMVPAGNPQGIQGLSDLRRPEVNLVNRQPGSGTRVWLDAQLKAMGCPPTAVAGYQREELTHMAVARAVARGEASVGLGILAAAAAHQLQFIPLTQEQYDLVVPDEQWNVAPVRTLVECIRSDRFAQAVEALGGYDLANVGQTTWVS
jgi:molybdate-binding protein/DNA-binding MarR family transcriptional regulator